MTTENHRIDQLFKEKLGNFEKNPPVVLFDKISEKMVLRGKVRRMNQFKSAISVAAATILILLAGWYTIDRNQIANNDLPAQFNQQNTQPEQNLTKLPQSNTVAETPAKANQQKSGSAFAGLTVRKPDTGQKNGKRLNNPVAVNSLMVEADSQVKVAVSNSGTSDKIGEKENPNLKKESFQSEAGTKNIPKKGDPLYFANANVTPAGQAKGARKANWAIKAEVSPMFGSQIQSGSSNVNAKSISTISGGMMASYKLNDRITISSGIRYSQMKQGSHLDYTLSKTSGITYLQPVEKDANISRDVSLYLPAVSSIVYSNGMQSTANTVFASDISQDFKYLEIPIQATYKLYKMMDNKLSVGISGGISTNFLVGNFASITENGITLSNGNTNNIRNVLYSGSAGLELGYDLGKNLVLTVEPRVKQYLHSVSSNDLVNFKPQQLGIFTGITYSFN